MSSNIEISHSNFIDDITILLKSTDISLPQVINENIDYKNFVEDKLSFYFSKINDLNQKYSFLKIDMIKLDKLCKLIKLGISLTYSGKTHDAYTKFKEAFSLIENILIENVSSLDNNIILFRMRISKSRQLSENEMFHLPFSKRRLISTQRYSIPGFPCLYLGSSLYVCWEELKQPLLSDLHVTKFSLNKNVPVLNLADTPQLFANKLDPSESNYNHIKEYLLKLPLIIAVSIKVNSEHNHFKPEYIVSQNLMQWLKSKRKVIGVKYFSTSVSSESLESPLMSHKLINYAFPVQIISDDYCKNLNKIFNIHKPLSLHTFMSINPYDSYTTIAPTPFDYLKINGEKIDYNLTNFGWIERFFAGYYKNL